MAAFNDQSGSPTLHLMAQLKVCLLLYYVLKTSPHKHSTCDTDGTDYESSEGYLIFEEGSSSGSVQCATVPIVNDEVKEDNESFTFAISAGGDGDIVLGRTRTEVYIVDDDGTNTFNCIYRLL